MRLNPHSPPPPQQCLIQARGKRIVFKIVMEIHRRLSDLAYRDRLLNLTLYDPKRRSSNDAKDLNWLWVKLVWERMLALLNNLHVRQTFATFQESILTNQNMVVISRSTTGYDYDYGWKDYDTLILIIHEGPIVSEVGGVNLVFRRLHMLIFKI